MTDLTTKYMGLDLRNPIVVGSCSLTSSLEDILALEQNGAAAIVLKSIFEEEILNESTDSLTKAKTNKLIYSQLSETLDYIDVHTKTKRLTDYLNLIKDAKKKALIPIIASINCVTEAEWGSFAGNIQQAGADGIELNISVNPLNHAQSDPAKTVLNIIKKVLDTVSIPVAVKLSDYFIHTPDSIVNISKSGIDGLVLFNRYYTPDIDIYNLNAVPGKMHSCDNEYTKPLRWVALLSDKIKCSLAASTGIHDGNTLIKQILAGADAVQIVSTLYLNGKQQINKILNETEKWMLDKGYFSIKQFKGVASYKNAADPAVYERIQFMKYFGRIG